ncbi:MAG: VCBS repeat-containing protein [Pseudomonadota bacterium]
MALCLGLATQAAGEIVSARYTEPTDRYPHGVLGDELEFATLEITLASGSVQAIRFPDTVVFEDTKPRLADLDGDGAPEVITVISHANAGAQFHVFGFRDGTIRSLANNPFIGTRFRWLAIVGIDDVDGDGFQDIVYVDRPHLAKTLRVWRVIPEGSSLRVEEVASLPGVTNHRIGEEDIAGGIRDCGSGPEMIVADADWQSVMAVRFDGTSFETRDLGPHLGRASFAEAMDC